MTGELRWRHGRTHNRIDQFYWIGANSRCVPLVYIYSIGGLTEIKAVYRGCSRTFARDDEGLKAAKEWCEMMRDTEILENERKIRSLVDDGKEMKPTEI